MNHAVIYAYTASNLGDDLFIYVLCRRYPHIRFTMYAPKIYRDTFRMIPNLRIFPSDKFINRMIHRTLKPFRLDYLYREFICGKNDLSIYIGGSLFAETNNWQEGVRNIHSMMKKSLLFLVIGANFGPYTSNSFYQTYADLFNRCTDVCFRDEKSKQAFKQLTHIRHAPDVIFQLPVMKKGNCDKTILFSVILPSTRDDLKGCDESYFAEMKRLAMHCIDQGYHVLFMSFCAVEKDNEAIEKIIANIPASYHKHIKQYLYLSDINEALEVISTVEAIVATRFHAMILGFIFGKPVYPIVYDEKMITVLEEIGFSRSYCHIKQVKKLQMKTVWSVLMAKPFDVSNEIGQAPLQFRMLDQLLE